MEFDELIERPHFADHTRRIEMAGSQVAISGAIGAIAPLGGLVFLLMAFASDTEPDEFLEYLLYATVGTVMGLIAIFAAVRAGKRQKALRSERLELTREYYEAERERLSELRSQMSVAEWENYKLQVQNQRLLKQINNKPVATKKTTTTWTMAIDD